jgi:hypothetical protein
MQHKAHGSCKTWPTSQILMWKSLLLHGKKKIDGIYWGKITSKWQDPLVHTKINLVRLQTNDQKPRVFSPSNAVNNGR